MISRLFLALTFFVGVVQAIPQNITIYTATFAPFSENGRGYSIDFALETIRRTWGNAPVVTVVTGTNNDFIFDNVLAHPANADTFALGISGITITAEREKRMNFLPAYYESGFKVLVHVTQSFNAMAQRLVRNFFLMMSFYGLVTLVIMSVLAPLAFFFEMMYPDIDPRDSEDRPHIPIFMDDYDGREHSSKQERMARDLMVTGIWATSTLLGTQTEYPNSKFARVVHVVLKGVGGVLVITLISAMTVVFSVTAVTNSIGGYTDLVGRSVCTTTNTTSDYFLQANDLGFHVLQASDSAQMMTKFWEKQCEAVVYDFPFLQQAVTDRGGGAALVGEVFNTERYGAMIRPGNPYEETLKQATVELTNDYAYNQALNDRWFRDTQDHTNQSFAVPDWVYIVPSVSGIGMLTLLGLYMWKYYSDHEAMYQKKRDEEVDEDFRDNLLSHLKEKLGDAIYYGNDWILGKKVLPWMYQMLLLLLKDRVEKDQAKEEQAKTKGEEEQKNPEPKVRQRLHVEPLPTPGDCVIELHNMLHE